MRYIVVLPLLALTGCALLLRDLDKPPPDPEGDALYNQVVHATADGCPVAEARKRLEAEGVVCLDERRQGLLTVATMAQEGDMHCSRAATDAYSVPHRVVVTVAYKDGRVTGVSSARRESAASSQPGGEG
jgi:hypothetical protein